MEGVLVGNTASTRWMGASVRTIDHHYGAFIRESEDEVRALLEAGAGRSGDVVATVEEE